MAQVSSRSPPFCSSCFAWRLISRASRIGFYPGPARHMRRVCPRFGTWYLDGNSLTLSGDWLVTERGLRNQMKICSHMFLYYMPGFPFFVFSSLASPSYFPALASVALPHLPSSSLSLCSFVCVLKSVPK